MRIISFKALTACSSCGQPIALDDVAERVTCPFCQAEKDLSPVFWRELLDKDDGAWWRKLEKAPRDVASIERTPRDRPAPLGNDRDAQWTLAYLRGAPPCSRCKAEALTISLTAGAEGVAAHSECSSCGDARDYAPLPSELTEANPSLITALTSRFEISDETRPARVVSRPTLGEPVVFACGNCGGALSVDGTSRTVSCAFCRADAFLPDDLWLRLHPTKRAETFCVVFGGTNTVQRGRAERKLRERNERQQKIARPRERVDKSRLPKGDTTIPESSPPTTNNSALWTTIGIVLALLAAVVAALATK